MKRSFSPTTEFEYLARKGLLLLCPTGRASPMFFARSGVDGYRARVKPDFVMPDGRWVDFKFRVSFREKHDVPWRPSALYSSLRKYIDHEANTHQTLTIVYGRLYGTIDEIVFPISRGRTVLIRDAAEFADRIRFVSVEVALQRLRGTSSEWILDKIVELSGRTGPKSA